MSNPEKVAKRRGRPPTGFDKKKYDRERIARIRAEAKANAIHSQAQLNTTRD